MALTVNVNVNVAPSAKRWKHWFGVNVRFILVLLAALLCVPRAASAADVAPARQSTRVAPRIELCAQAVIARAESREPVLFDATPLTPPALADLSARAACVAVVAPERSRPADSFATERQPPARAPPLS